MSAHQPKLRTFRDRLRHIALFEAGGLVLITPPFAWASGLPVLESSGLLALLALLAAVWNGVYNTGFDWLDARLSGRCADRRPLTLRLAQAAGFEGGLLVMSLPIVMWGTGLGWFESLVADIGLAAAYAAYAFGYNLAYDRVFPIEPLRGTAGVHAD